MFRRCVSVSCAGGTAAFFLQQHQRHTAHADSLNPPPAPMSLVEQAKKKAAYAAVDEFVRSGQVVGVGSGSTVVYAVDRLAERVRREGLQVVCVTTSFQSQQLCARAGLPYSDLDRHALMDVAIDGADEVDPDLNCIKGGGCCHTKEKIVAHNSKKFIVIADYRKDSQALGVKWRSGIPIAVVPMAYVPVMRAVEKMGGKPVLRQGVRKAGPVVDDCGNFVLDCDFGSLKDVDPQLLHNELIELPGVVETGLFCGMAEKAFFGQEDGSVIERVAPKRTPSKAHLEVEVKRLRQQLASTKLALASVRDLERKKLEAIGQQNFEEATRCRDQLLVQAQQQ